MLSFCLPAYPLPLARVCCYDGGRGPQSRVIEFGAGESCNLWLQPKPPDQMDGGHRALSIGKTEELEDDFAPRTGSQVNSHLSLADSLDEREGGEKEGGGA